MRLGRCSRWDRLFVDPFGLEQRGGLLLNHRSPLVEQRITSVWPDEPGGVHFHFIAHAPNDWRLMTFGAGVSVEQWAQAIFWLEDPLEHLLTLVKLGTLFERQFRQRLPKSGLLGRFASPMNQRRQEEHGTN